MSEVRAVVLIVRHGARNTASNSCGNLSFPSSGSNKYWDDHSMKLVPVGVKQLESIGKELASHYPHLLKDDLHDRVRVFSSNTQRTVASAEALLEGMLPGYPHYITHNGDVERDGSDYSTTYHSMGIEISVENSKRTDTLFNAGPAFINEYVKWKENNIKTSPVLLELAEDEEVINLLDKLYTMTSCENISPTRASISRLRRITNFITLLRYSELSGTPLIPNRLNLVLDDDEKALIVTLANAVYKEHFNPEMGRKVAGHLLSSAAVYLDDVAQGREKEGIRIYSCHDTTLLAVAAALQINIQAPNFAGYFLLELVSNSSITASTGVPSINICYNPGDKELSSLKCVNIPLKALSDFTFAPAVKSIRRWVESYSTPNINRHESIIREPSHTHMSSSRPGSQPGSPRLSRRVPSSNDNNLLGLETPTLGIDEVLVDPSVVAEAFSYYDIDGDGVINDEEFILMLKRMGIRHTSADEATELYDELIGDGVMDMNLLLSQTQRWSPTIGV